MKKRARIISAFMAAIMAASALSAFPASAAEDARIDRIYGENRYGTAAAIAERVKELKGGSVSSIVVASGETYADALTGVSYAAQLGAPIYLTPSNSTDIDLVKEIVGGNVKNAYILGGPYAVSETTENDMTGRGVAVTRVYGQDRFETAAETAKALIAQKKAKKEKTDTVFIVSGENFPDALSAAPVAGILKYPVLYSCAAGTLDEKTKNVIKENKIKKAYIIGGPYAVGTNVASALADLGVLSIERIYGEDRYGTSASIYERFKSCFGKECISAATGQSFADALTGAVYSSMKKAPLMIVEDGKTAKAHQAFAGLDDGKLIVYGGPLAVSEENAEEIISPAVTLDFVSESAEIENITGVETDTEPYIWDGKSDITFTASADDGYKAEYAAIGQNGDLSVFSGNDGAFTISAETFAGITEDAKFTVEVYTVKSEQPDEAAVVNNSSPVYPQLAGSTSIGTGNRGDRYVVLGSKAASSGTIWYEINFNGKVGWISSRNAALVTAPDPSMSCGDETLDAIAANYGTIGMQVALIENGEVTDCYNYGMATIGKEKMTTEHKTRVASLSKVALAMDAAKMQEEGIIDWNTDISRYWGKALPKQVTLTNLFSHVSTLKSLSYIYNAEGVLGQIEKADSYRNGTPGDPDKWEYSNYGVGIAGVTMEVAAGRTVSDHIAEKVFEPIGVDASWAPAQMKNKKFTTLYWNDGTLQRTPEYTASITGYPAGGNSGYFAGGLTINAEDLAKVTATLANDGTYGGVRALSEDSVALLEKHMFTATENGASFTQCLPLRYVQNYCGQDEVYYHSGNAYGVLSLMIYNPVTKNGVTVITTGTGTDSVPKPGYDEQSSTTGRDAQGVYEVCGRVADYAFNNLIG